MVTKSSNCIVTKAGIEAASSSSNSRGVGIGEGPLGLEREGDREVNGFERMGRKYANDC